MRFIIVFLFCFPTLVLGQNLSVAQKLEDFDQLNQIILNDYGPLLYKEQNLGIDTSELTSKYRNKIVGLRSDQDFHSHIFKFVAEFKDSHFSARVPSTYQAYLGFSTDFINSKVLIENIDREVLPESEFMFSKGDEIVAVDGRPVIETIKELKQYFGMGNGLTTTKLAVFSIPLRQEKSVPLPVGRSISLAIRKSSDGTVYDTEVNWGFRGEKLDPQDNSSAHPIGRDDWCSSTSRIDPPADAVFIDDVPFTAYYFATNKGNVGFLRIPHYYPKNSETGFDEFKKRFQQYERAISILERQTVGLIIDQDYNCGGSVAYLQKILSLFVSEKFEPMTFEFRASETQIEALSNHLEKFDSDSQSYQHFLSAVESVEDAFDQGLFSTPRIPFWGFMEYQVELPGQTYIERNPVHYTKPIVVLINELSGSGGDVFPGMIKDLGRAKLFGKTTMGAGGHAWDDPPLALKNSGMQINLTRSLIYRPNGEAIENSGVSPDVEYEVTEDDFTNGYRSYFEKALDYLKQSL